MKACLLCIRFVVCTIAGLLGVGVAAAGDPLFSPPQNYPAGDGPRSVAVADLDGDQVLDLAVANVYSDNVSVLLGLGDGTFAAAVHYSAGDGPYSLAIAELNGDEAPDLAVANRFSQDVSVLLNNGDGTFAAAVHYPAGSSPLSIAIGDLNGDEAPDLAMASRSPHNVSVLMNNGDGTFAAPLQYAVGDDPISVAIGDLNGDEAADLAVANEASNTVSVLLNNGDGTFDAAVHYGAGSGPYCVAIADLNGDEALDLAVSNYYSDNVSVLLNNGDGTFASAVHYAAGDTARYVAIGDLDGDNAADLGVANADSDSVSVLLNNGDGTFTFDREYPVGNGPFSVAIGDVKGDGAADLAVPNYYSDDVSVLLNRRLGTAFYVDDDAPPGGDGLAWNTAFDELQAALQVVSAGDEVRVGGGLYTPESRSRGHIIAVHVLTDFAPDETTWELVEQGAGVVATGGPYAQPMHLYTHEIPVDPGCYDFTIFDAACNGLFPGVGFYDVYLDGELVGWGGEFGCSETVPDICPGGAPAPREATFQLVNGVALYGGFAGYGTPDPNERNIELYETVLSGDLAGDDDPAQFPAGPSFAENSYHVVTGGGTDGSAVLDGFTITGGNANGEDDETAGGGGMYNYQGSPTVRNCTFEANYAIAVGGEAGGGGVFNWHQSEPTFVHCVFTGNAAEDRGGAVCNNHQWEPGFTPTFIYCTFNENSSNSRSGGMHSYHCTPMLVGCSFSGNTASRGGGMYNKYDDSSPTLVNCLFSGNSATHGGAVYLDSGSEPTLINCTLYGNTAVEQGGGVGSTYGGGFLTVTNCVLWGNSDNSGSGETAQLAVSAADIDYSCVQGWTGSFGGTGNIGDDPRLVDPGNGDCHLSPGSPCIDAADNTAVPPDQFDLDGDGDTGEPTPLDLDGNPRFVDDPTMPDTGNGDPPLVDMGTYERQVEGFSPGDLNCDGVLNAFDIDPFVLALTDPAGYAAAWPDCDRMLADCNSDGVVNAFDIDPFVELLTGG